MEANQYRSAEINHIMGALAKAQGTYKPLVANEDAPGGKFANLQAILASVKESLSANGLGFYQYIELLDEGDGAALLKTVLGHESGQYIASCGRVVTEKNERTTGNRYEIYKRFHALMILGIAPSKTDPMAFDDNGEELADDQLVKELRTPRTEEKKEVDNTKVISKDQYTELQIELDGYPEIAKDVLAKHKIETLADLPRSEYHKCRVKILEIKKRHNEFLRTGK